MLLALTATLVATSFATFRLIVLLGPSSNRVKTTPYLLGTFARGPTGPVGRKLGSKQLILLTLLGLARPAPLGDPLAYNYLTSLPYCLWPTTNCDVLFLDGVNMATLVTPCSPLLGTQSNRSLFRKVIAQRPFTILVVLALLPFLELLLLTKRPKALLRPPGLTFPFPNYLLNATPFASPPRTPLKLFAANAEEDGLH